MSDRPRGVLAMSQYARDAAFPSTVEARVAEYADVDFSVRVSDFSAPEYAAALRQADFLLTGWGCPPITATELDAMPRLRLIAHAAGSVKHHLDAAVWRREIAVSSAAAANAEPVAEYTRAVILLASKRFFVRAARYPHDGWPPVPERRDCGSFGRTVGVVGASLIGKRVLDLLREYDMRLLLHDPYCDSATAAELGAELVELDALCRQSDVVTVHAPQLPSTRHLIDDRRLGLLRDGAILVNTARGSLVDTEALARHCRDGRIDAVLDVTDPEPLPAGHELFGLPNVTITPHLAGAQGSEIAALGQWAADEARRFFAGEALQGAVVADDLPKVA